MKFIDLGVAPSLLKSLKEEGYERATDIQVSAIPPILAGRDLLGCAQTGTGKTCAFAVPTLQRLDNAMSTASNSAKGAELKPTERSMYGVAGKPEKGTYKDMGRSRSRGPKGPIRCLVLTPTRELALQIYDSYNAYGRFVHLKNAVIFGGVPQKPQEEVLAGGVDILVATPGRLLDMMNQGLIDLSHIEICVLDEADRMLDMGFIHDVKRILAKTPRDKQMLLFSATMPEEIAAMADAVLKDPVRVEVTPVSSTVDKINQYLYFVDKSNKRKLLGYLLKDSTIESALVFTRTKHGADRLAKDLNKAGINAYAIHGDKAQGTRQAALNKFKNREARVLVATDIAARGIDIELITHVFNFELPNVPETYVHRIGRTGRAGQSGVAVSFCDFEEKALLKDIEKTIRKKIQVVERHPYPMEIFEVLPKNTQLRMPRLKPSTGRKGDTR